MKEHPLFDIIQAELEQVEQGLVATIDSQVNLVQDIGTHLIRAGGKRLRPALYLLCNRATGEPDPLRGIPMAMALELIHMATLVHDDVIDNADTRRNKPTANACWGNQLSVLTGDYLFAKAFSLISSHFDGTVMRILSDVVCSMSEGEIIQSGGAFNPVQTKEEYELRIAKKTADFIAASCQLGALTAEMKPTSVQAMRNYGSALGMAFQVTDDILDITASDEQLGKPVGNDLRQGIVTLPTLYALQHSSAGEELRMIINSQDMSDTAIQRGLDIILATDAVEYSYQEVERYLLEAKEVLPVELEQDVREALIAVADFIGIRKY